MLALLAMQVAMALMVGAAGKAVGVEHVPQLVQTSINNVANDGIARRVSVCVCLCVLYAPSTHVCTHV